MLEKRIATLDFTLAETFAALDFTLEETLARWWATHRTLHSWKDTIKVLQTRFLSDIGALSANVRIKLSN